MIVFDLFGFRDFSAQRGRCRWFWKDLYLIWVFHEAMLGKIEETGFCYGVLPGMWFAF